MIIIIKFALISVYNKDGIDEIAKKLSDLEINIISTGGTEKYLKLTKPHMTLVYSALLILN